MKYICLYTISIYFRIQKKELTLTQNCMNKNLLRGNIGSKFLSLIFCIVFVVSVKASYMKNVPMRVTQPDGTILNCLATGNEFHNWMHDSNNYTIIKNQTSGFYVYAIIENGKLIPSNFIAGQVDPSSIGIQPGVNLSDTEVVAKTQQLKAQKAVPQSNLRTSAPQSVRQASGVYNNLVVFISFSDQGEITLPMSTITSKFNAVGSASVRDFYKEASNSQLDLVSSFYPTSPGTYPVSYHDSHPRSYYTKDAPDGYDNATPNSTTREHTLLANAVKAVQNQVPANLMIDGDNDGNIDNIVFVINGVNEGWSELLWPHRWSLYSQTVKINNKRAYDYNIVFSDALGIGVICHELFHSFGATDLYHYTDYPHEPSGDWDLMSSGDWNSPRHMTVYLKQNYAKWSPSIPVLTDAGRYSLAPVSRSSFAAYRINLPNTDQYLVLEYRKKEGFYESKLGGDEGLLIYRVNPTIDGNGANGPEELYIYRPGGTNAVNGNLNQATFSQNKNRTKFDNTTNPSAFLADGSLAGLAANLGITNVSVVGEVISFDYKGGSSNKSPVITLTAPVTNATYNGPASITISANASDADGTISRVDFYSGTVLLSSDASVPYSYTWTNVAAGTYTITAKATDNLGATAVTAGVTVSVLAPICTLANTKLNTTNYLGTAGSYSGTTNDNKDKVFDGNVNTFFDAASGDASWAGLDLVSNKKITGVRFYPRANYSDRMVGGKFQGSSTADFSAGVVDLYTIATAPAYGWNCVNLTNATAIRYVRYLAPINGYGNVNEVEFYGTAVANALPIVSITSPTNNATFTMPATITLSANASDTDGTIASVAFYTGATLLYKDVSAPYNYSWTNVAVGTYTITAKATDNNGAITTSAAITLIVNPACTPTAIIPYIQINGAWSNSTMATLLVGGSVKFGPQPVTTGSWSWTGPKNFTATTRETTVTNIQLNQAGNYVATYTNDGGCTSTQTFVVTVTAPENVLPTIAITSPTNNASFTAPASVTISANATDSDGTISKVEFYNGTVLLSSDTNAPYTYTWTAVTAGTYTIHAKATDNVGGTVTSNSISIAVINPTTPTENCIMQTAPVADQWVVRNDWADQGNGSAVVTATNAINIKHRQWGNADLWVIETGKAINVVSGQTYTVSFDFKNDAQNPVTEMELGFATGEMWNGAVLAQPAITVSAGLPTSYTTKTVTISSTTTGVIYLAYKFTFAGQPNNTVNLYMKNIDVCSNANAAQAMAASPNATTDIEFLNAIKVGANPFLDQTTIHVIYSTDVALNVTMVDINGTVVWDSNTLHANQIIYLGSGLPVGVYMVTAQYEGITKTFRLLKR